MPAYPEIEAALAEEAAAHAHAAAELNPFGEAEALELGSARLVYAGAFSPVHGVYALGLDGPAEAPEFAEIRRFFQRKEREPNFYLTPFTDPSVAAQIAGSHRATLAEEIHGWSTLPVPTEPAQIPPDAYLAGPDHGEWQLAFTRSREPNAREPDLLSAIKLHQKNTRFYLLRGQASYTFFHRGVALVPYPAGAELLELQKKEAMGFRSTAFVVKNFSPAPLLYERKIHEPL